MEELSRQEQDFVKEVSITDNKTKAAQKAFKIKDPDYRHLRTDK